MRQRQLLIAFGILLLAAVAAMVWTGEWFAPDALHREQTSSAAKIVDQSPLQTAQMLAPLAVTPDEQSLAQEALHTADQEVDLAFESALRNAIEHPPTLTAEARKIEAQIVDLEARIKVGQARVAQLDKQVEAATDSSKEDDLRQEFDLTQAQLDLDEDDLAEAKEDLIRAGGDKRSLIQRMMEERHAAQPPQTTPSKITVSSASPAAAPAPKPVESPHSLVGQISAWSDLRSKQKLLAQAQKEALLKFSELAESYKNLQSQVSVEKKQKSGVVAQRSNSKESAAAALAALQGLSSRQQNLVKFDKRVQAEKELGDIYGSWSALVKIPQRTISHAIAQSLVLILFLVVLLLSTDLLIERYFADLTPERKRLRTLRNVVRFAVQALGAVLILLVIFGPPNQLATVLALAGAGLTVALKDFIVGFFGWFVLMGRNGIRIGDWVEINGVGGEVVEIDLLHTVLLETGNWNDAGHPTGRRVSFVNSYAIEGHYFNFSTSGQWLWDELRVLVPAGEDPTAMALAFQKVVSADTEANARLAEQEWQHVASARKMSSFTATPGISVRPTGAGIEITVRYITRASERQEVRARLYQAVVDILQHKKLSRNTSPLPIVAPEQHP
jgi:small-conductance mechanosensitive channel